MNSKTTELLLRLERTDWFCNAGNPLEVSPDVVQVKTWVAALEICASEPSKTASLEADNELTVYLSSHHGAAYSRWNILVEQIKPSVTKLVEMKLGSPAVRARLPNDARNGFIDRLKWDLVSIAMACEYDEYIRTKYYELLEHWYLAGRFPCGWIGQVPEDFVGAFGVGKLAVL